MWSYLQLGVMGTCTAFAPNYASYCVFRFAGGMALSGFGLSIACLGEGTRGQCSGLGTGPWPRRGTTQWSWVGTTVDKNVPMARDGDIQVARDLDITVAMGGVTWCGHV